MPRAESVILVVAAVSLIVALTALARRLPLPTPILQVVAGALIALLPGAPIPDLDPDLVFNVFLPPVLWSAAMFTSVRDFRRNLRPITWLAVGLVLATTVAVAVAAHALFPGLPWPVAAALGAIVSPPDAVAAAAIVSRLPVPRRAITILEGESLVNDASALILYRTAVAAAVTGTFSWGEAIVRFFIDAGIGTLVGLIVAWLVVRVLKWTRDPLPEALLTLAGPYVAWLTAEQLHASAVLACVAGGVYLQQRLSTAVTPTSRVLTRAIWDLVVFLLNATIFLGLGAQAENLLALMPSDSRVPVIWSGVVITGVVIAVRLIWVPLVAVRSRLSLRGQPRPPVQWKAVAFVGWTSMRGLVSLATALALPLAVGGGRPFPYRTEMILVAVCVILLTLVVQGLTLRPLIKFLKFAPESAPLEEERLARREMMRRGAEMLEDLAHEPWADPRDVEALRAELRDRLHMTEQRGGSFAGRRRLRLAVIDAERRMLIRLRNEDAISDQVLRALEHELDLEALRAGVDDDGLQSDDM